MKTSLAPDAREQGTVLGLGGHGTNQSTVPVLSTVLSVRLQGQEGRQSPHSPGTQSGGQDGCWMCPTTKRSESHLGQRWWPWVNRSGAHPAQGAGKPS